ncbi:MAG: LysR family transcriptional regulator [Gammaproteobacteria bacterium]|jgi:DNA-binding transcriptional LysR family regulator|nr:LysR family transcriptional regulator [Gammaproteobacteria bacterium]
MTSRLDLQTLHLFTTVATVRNIAKAAEQEHIAASAVSKRISELEDALATTLFYRLRRGVELAPAGQALLHHTTAIFRSIDRLKSDMAEYAQGVRGHVRMMANLTSIMQFLTKDLSTFAIAHPEIKIDLTESSTPAIVKAVSDGLVDFGIIADVRVKAPGDIAPGLALENYRHDKMAVVVPAGHPLSKKKSVGFREAAEYDFVGLHAHGGWETLMMNAAQAAGCSLRIRIRVPSYDAMLRLVEAGLGITIVPPGACASHDRDQIRVIRLAEAWAERTLKICYRDLKLLPVTARMLIEHLRAETESHETSRRLP